MRYKMKRENLNILADSIKQSLDAICNKMDCCIGNTDCPLYQVVDGEEFTFNCVGIAYSFLLNELRKK